MAIDDVVAPVLRLLNVRPFGSLVILCLCLAMAMNPQVLSVVVIAMGLFLSLALLTLQTMRKNRKMRINWNDHVILITGAANGVGKMLVESLITRKPKRIIALDITKCDFKSDLVLSFVCDVSRFDDLKKVAETLKTQGVGPVSILINNAGVVNAKKFIDLSESDMLKTINVNLIGVLFSTKVFLPDILTHGEKGHIINVASLLGNVGCAGVSDYCASKFGVVGFHESLRQELSSKKTKLSIIYPGLIDTGMFNGVQHKFPFLTPALRPAQVVDQLIKIMEDGISTDASLPFYVKLSYALRTLPIELLDWIKNVTGANEDMNKFKGRPKN